MNHGNMRYAVGMLPRAALSDYRVCRTRSICVRVNFVIYLFIAQLCYAQPRDPAFDPLTYKPPEFAHANNHIKLQFLPDSREWERIDIYIPTEMTDDRGQGLSCVVLFYGGGWRGKVMFPAEEIEGLLNNGYVVAVPDYVLTAQQPVPAAVWDGAAAIRFLRANAAKYRIDPERVGAMGVSAGGWLLQYLAVSDSGTLLPVSKAGEPRFLVPAVERHPANEPFSAKLSAFVCDWGANQLHEIGGNALSADDPPLFTIHNDREGKWPPGPKAYAGAGATVDLAIVGVEDTHAVVGVSSKWVRDVVARDSRGIERPLGDLTLDFLERHLKHPSVTVSPEILPNGGPIHEPQTVVLRSVHPSAKIHFTVDGSMPDESDPIYSGQLTVRHGQTVRAVAIKPGLKPSAVTSARFTRCELPQPVISTLASHFEATAGQPFSTTFEAKSAAPVTWHIAGKVCPVSDTSNPPRAMPAFEIDPKSGRLSGMSSAAGTAVFIVVAAVQDGEAYLCDARMVTVTVK